MLYEVITRCDLWARQRHADTACGFGIFLHDGTVDQTIVFPREVFTRALELKASGVVLVHNHPGGDPRPSSQDVELTRRMVRAATDLGLRVLDHLVVTERAFYSFQQEGML